MIYMRLFLKGLYRGGILCIFMSIMSLWEYYQGSTINIKTFLLNGLILLIVGITSVIYNISSLSFFKQIIVHYTIMLLTVFPILLFSGYYSLGSSRDVLNVYLLFNTVGIKLFMATFVISYVYKRFIIRK